MYRCSNSLPEFANLGETLNLETCAVVSAVGGTVPAVSISIHHPLFDAVSKKYGSGRGDSQPRLPTSASVLPPARTSYHCGPSNPRCRAYHTKCNEGCIPRVGEMSSADQLTVPPLETLDQKSPKPPGSEWAWRVRGGRVHSL